MGKRLRRRKVPRVSLLDTSKVGELARAIEQMGELVASMKATLPGLLELVNVSRELLTITSRMHALEQQQLQGDQADQQRRSDAARRANQTRRARKDQGAAAIPAAIPAIEINGEVQS